MEFPLLKFALFALAQSLPALIVCTVAVLLLVARRGPLQAIVGFGLIGTLTIVMPVFHTLVARVQLPTSTLVSVHQAAGLVSTIAHCGGYVLILLGFLKLLPKASRE